MKIIDKSISAANKLFEHDYLYNRKKYRTFHYAFAVRKNSIIEYGTNSYNEDIKIYKLGLLLNNNKQIKFKNRHAEVDLLLKLSKKTYLNNITIISIRLSKSGIQDSKPCPECEKTMKYFGIKKIYFFSTGQLYFSGT